MSDAGATSAEAPLPVFALRELQATACELSEASVTVAAAKLSYEKALTPVATTSVESIRSDHGIYRRGVPRLTSYSLICGPTAALTSARTGCYK